MILRQYVRWILRRRDPATGEWTYWTGSEWSPEFHRAMAVGSKRRVRMMRMALPDGPYGGVHHNRIYDTRPLPKLASLYGTSIPASKPLQE